MSITQLTSIVPPPVDPVECGPLGLRASIEESLGLPLPQDFVDIAITYGSGTFSEGQFWVLNPFAWWYRSNIDQVCRIFQQLKADEGNGFIPFDLYPKKPGLLPWGGEANGDQMFWLTNGEPNEWPIVLFCRDGGGFEEWKMPVSTFLSKVFACELKCILWSDDTQQTLRPEFESGW